MDLEQALQDPVRRSALLDACVAALEDEVAAKRGVGGMALRTAYRAFDKVQPGMARTTFGKLLPEFVPALQPLWNEARAGDPAAWFEGHRGEVADALLAVTDARAERASNPMLRKLYRSLRGSARHHVSGAVPRIATILASVSPDRSLV